MLSEALCLTLGEGFVLVIILSMSRPLENHDITAGGLLMDVSHFSLIVSPALACSWPEIITFFGGTRNIK